MSETTWKTESVYYVDREESDKRHLKSVKSDLRKFIKESHITDLEFVLEIINNLEDWKGMIRILGKR